MPRGSRGGHWARSTVPPALDALFTFRPQAPAFLTLLGIGSRDQREVQAPPHGDMAGCWGHAGDFLYGVHTGPGGRAPSHHSVGLGVGSWRGKGGVGRAGLGADGLSAAFHCGPLRRPLTVASSWDIGGSGPGVPAGHTPLSWSGSGAHVVPVFGVSPDKGALAGGAGQPWGKHQTSHTVI